MCKPSCFHSQWGRTWRKPFSWMASNCKAYLNSILPDLPSLTFNVHVQPDDDPLEAGKVEWVDIKREIWHSAVQKVVESIKTHAEFGTSIRCGDGKERQIFPRIIMISANYEEQYVNHLDSIQANIFTYRISLPLFLPELWLLSHGVLKRMLPAQHALFRRRGCSTFLSNLPFGQQPARRRCYRKCTISIQRERRSI